MMYSDIKDPSGQRVFLHYSVDGASVSYSDTCSCTETSPVCFISRKMLAGEAAMKSRENNQRSDKLYWWVKIGLTYFVQIKGEKTGQEERAWWWFQIRKREKKGSSCEGEGVWRVLCRITKCFFQCFVSACLLRHTYAMYGKEGIFPDLNSQLFCSKFHSCDQKLDDLVSRTATK